MLSVRQNVLITTAAGLACTLGTSANAISAGVTPVNDDCADAIAVALNSTTSGTTTDSTFDDVGPCGTSNTTGGVWYTFIGDGNAVEITTCGAGTNYDTKLSVFTGTCGALSCVDGNDDNACPFSGLHSRVRLCDTESGTTYRILVHGFGSNTGDFELTLSSFSSPANDDVCNAIHVPVNSSTAFNNLCAAAQPGEPSPGPGSGDSCNSQDGWCSFETDVQSSVWYTFTAPPCGGVEINATSIDFQLAVWQVGMCNNFATFTEIAANDDSGPGLSPRLTLCDLTPGETYYIQIDGFGSILGPGMLDVDEYVCTDCNTNGIDDDCEILDGLAYDCNCNGVPDECDLMDPLMDINNDGYIDSCTACAGDVNCDGVVNGLDVMEVFSNFGSPGPYADVNQDGIVNAFDYYIVIWNYGRVCL